MISHGFGVGLEKISEADLDTLRAWRNNPQIWKWTRQNDLISEADQLKWYQKQCVDPTLRMYTVNFEGKLVGVTGLTSIDFQNARAEFSLYISPNFHGSGLGKKALLTLFQHGFKSLGLHCIWGETFEGNRAEHLFVKIGMKKEGTRREFYWKDGRFLDAHLYSLLRSEWVDLLPAWEKAREKASPALSYF